MRKLLVLATPWLFLVFAACGGGSDPKPPSNDTPPQILSQLCNPASSAGLGGSSAPIPFGAPASSASSPGSASPSTGGAIGGALGGGCAIMNQLQQAHQVCS